MPKTSFEFMRDSDSWPMWPRLPLKRDTDHGREVGYLLAGHRPEVFMGNVFSSEKPTASQDYVSFEDIVADGWMID